MHTTCSTRSPANVPGNTQWWRIPTARLEPTFTLATPARAHICRTEHVGTLIHPIKLKSGLLIVDTLQTRLQLILYRQNEFLALRTAVIARLLVGKDGYSTATI